MEADEKNGDEGRTEKKHERRKERKKGEVRKEGRRRKEAGGGMNPDER